MKLKHGYIVKGMSEDGQEFSYGKCDTKHQALKSYLRTMNADSISAFEKKTLRIIELVEHDITAELMELTATIKETT
jgi:hypothetical protein